MLSREFYKAIWPFFVKHDPAIWDLQWVLQLLDVASKTDFQQRLACFGYSKNKTVII
jgi:hypothetical protein